MGYDETDVGAEPLLPYPWDQCELCWDNRVGWIPNCEDAAPSTHPPPPPHTHTHEHHGASAHQCRARPARPACPGLVTLNMSPEPHRIWPPTSCASCASYVS